MERITLTLTSLRDSKSLRQVFYKKRGKIARIYKYYFFYYVIIHGNVDSRLWITIAIILAIFSKIIKRARG